MKSVALFNNEAGVGKTTLIFTLSHMMARQGLRTVVLDYDPQCHISAIALGEENLFAIWDAPQSERGTTVAQCIDLVRRPEGDIRDPDLVEIADSLWVLPGDLALSRFEQPLAQAWAQPTDHQAARHITTALQRLADRAAAKVRADVALIDVGPSLGALNRSALLAADVVVVSVAPDPFSLQGLKNVGPMMREWREDWRVEDRGGARAFEPRGYIVESHRARVDRLVSGDERWARQIPRVFHEYVLGASPDTWPERPEDDPYALAVLKNFAGLVPIAQLAQKPIVDLKHADGIAAGQIQAVVRARNAFQALVVRLTSLLGVG